MAQQHYNSSHTEKKHSFKRAKTSGAAESLNEYKRQRNQAVTLLRVSKQTFFNSWLNSASAKEFWKTVRFLNKSSTSIPVLTTGNTQVATNIEKANLLNKYFYGCFNPTNSISSSHSEVDCDISYPTELLCNEDDVADILSHLDAVKATGTDGISAKMLKAVAFTIAPSLTKLFNLSLSNGIIPSEWKTSTIVPVPKGPNRSSPSGYRPVSLLPIVSKTLEKHVSTLVRDHLAITTPIPSSQWGFMPEWSTISALITVVNEWLQALDEGNEICVIFFDVQKAFDSVPHIPLLNRLAEIELPPAIIRWLKNYLADRVQFVAIEGAQSDILPVISCVPQGSVLGPLLFITYINDIAALVSEGSKINMFADDIALYRIIKSPLDYMLQKDINAIASSLHMKQLSLNKDKCCYLFISRKRSQLIQPPSLTVDSNPLKRVQSYKYLGVLITADLTWSTHLQVISTKTRKLLSMFYRRFYSNSTSSTMLKLYKSFIRPNLEYAAVLWNVYHSKDVAMLENVQKFALRICTKSWNTSYEDLLSASSLPKLSLRRHKLRLLHLYKIYHQLTFFPSAPVIPRQVRYNSRSINSKALNPIQTKSKQTYYSFFPRTITEWNSLPNDIVSKTTSVSFSNALKLHLKLFNIIIMNC